MTDESIHDEILLKATTDFGRALAPEDRAIVDAHLRDCADCRAALEQLRAAHAALASWGDQPAPLPGPRAVPTSAIPTTAGIAAAGGVGAAAGGPAVRGRPWPLLAAASLIGLLLGATGGVSADRAGLLGERAAPPEPVADTRPVFTLLLEETASSWPPVGAMRSGYVEWRDSLIARGEFAGGRQFDLEQGWHIASDGTTLPMAQVAPARRGPTTYSGFFLVRAADYQEAIAIARQSPHLAFGTILVRGPN